VGGSKNYGTFGSLSSHKVEPRRNCKKLAAFSRNLQNRKTTPDIFPAALALFGAFFADTIDFFLRRTP